MILFYGRGDDPPLLKAAEAAGALAVPHQFIDQAHLASADLAVEIGRDGVSGRMIAAGQEIVLATVSAVYARPLGLPLRGLTGLGRIRAEAFHEIFVEWLDMTRCRVVNRPAAMESNSSKPLQAQLIARHGFPVPDTLVTNHPEEVRAFQERHRTIVFKSISGVRSIVRTLDVAAARRLDRLADLPVQFQAYVAGTDIRVHVIGDRVFPAEVRSEATDYRYAARDGQDVALAPIELPTTIVERATALAAALGLSFCGIDLRRTPDGEYVCFEVNPMPAYSYYEEHTGVAISRALVEFLAKARHDPGEVPHGADDRESHAHLGRDRLPAHASAAG